MEFTRAATGRDLIFRLNQVWHIQCLTLGMLCRLLPSRSMKRPRPKAVIVAAFLLVAALAVHSLIQTHKESAPLPQFQDQAALHDWATNSLPLLLEWLRRDQTDYRQPAFITLVNDLLDRQKKIKFRMGSAEPPNRTRAAYDFLCAIGEDGKPVIPDLIALLGNKSERLPGLACNILQKMAPVSIPALIEVLGKQNEQARILAATTLQEIGPDARVAIPALRETLTNNSLAVRFAAARALANLGDNSNQILDVILQGVTSGNDEICDSAFYTLWRLGTSAQPTVPGLVTIITNTATRERERFGTVWALRAMDRCELVSVIAGLNNAGLRSNIITKLRPFDHETAAEIQAKMDARH